MPGNYVAGSTGYKPGRPRKGEVRPPSPNAIAAAAYRAERHARDPSWREELAAVQRDWRAKNYERSCEISRAADRRARAWNKLESKDQVEYFVKLAKECTMQEQFDKRLAALRASYE